MDKRLEKFYKWYEARSHSEHLWILLLGVVLITLIWYFLIFHPLTLKKMLLVQKERDLEKSIQIYREQIATISIEGPKKLAQQKQQTQQKLSSQQKLSTMTFQFNSAEQHDLLVKTIFSKQTHVKFTSLKSGTTLAETKDKQIEKGQNLEIFFQGGYFDTIAYLESLEKLPWCLSWDTLEYKVLTYPEAEVTLQLHT